MIIVFDLDDTLYDETSYVKSGFQAVAWYLERELGLSAKDSIEFMVKRLSSGRGHIFDDLLLANSQYKKNLVRKCLSIYRSHVPTITLDPEAASCLARLSRYPIYIVTDGNKNVQKNKIEALGLLNRVKFNFITYRYGRKHGKPSPYCFFKICQMEKVESREVVYIGDNPKKDFVGIKPLGFKTIRILKGQYADLVVPLEYDAQYYIKSLDELTDTYLEKVFLED